MTMRACHWPWRLVLLGSVLVLCSSRGATPANAPVASLSWVAGPARVSLRNVADLNLPEGHLFLDEGQARGFLEKSGSRTSGKEVGLIAKAAEPWFVVVEYLDLGYVDPQEAGKLDASKLLAELQRRDARDRQGQPWTAAVTVAGWELPPAYDATRHRMEWAINGVSRGALVANHTISLLGRSGALQFTLVDQHHLASTLSAFQALLDSTQFRPGEDFQDHQPGDRAATGGLAALLLGPPEPALSAPTFDPRSACPPGGLAPLPAWAMIGGAALAGIVFGFLLGRRGQRRKWRGPSCTFIRIEPQDPLARTTAQVPGLPLARAGRADTAPQPVSAAQAEPLAPAWAEAGAPAVSLKTVALPTPPRPRRRYDVYRYYSRLTRDLHWTNCR